MTCIKFKVWDRTRNEMFCDNNKSSIKNINFDENGKVESVVLFEAFQDYIALKILNADDFILLQSTGLFDKNGVEIFEEDIVIDRGYKLVIKWQSGSFFLIPIKYSTNVTYAIRQLSELQVAEYLKNSCEVVGTSLNYAEKLKI